MQKFFLSLTEDQLEVLGMVVHNAKIERKVKGDLVSVYHTQILGQLEMLIDQAPSEISELFEYQETMAQKEFPQL